MNSTTPRISLLGLLTLILFLLSLATGCAFDDGNPWGWMDTDLMIESVPSSDELTLDSQSVIVTSIGLLASGNSGGGVSDFDPADPPPGYSLCHSGHCHADDGSLVDYEDIIAGTGNAPAGPRQVANRQLETEIDIDGDITERLKIVEQIQITQTDLTVERLNLSGTLSDGRDLDISLNLASRPFAADIRYEFGADKAEEQHVSLRLQWPADLFDGIDFTDVSTDEEGQLIPIHGGRNRTLYDQLIARIESGAQLLWEED